MQGAGVGRGCRDLSEFFGELLECVCLLSSGWIGGDFKRNNGSNENSHEVNIKQECSTTS